MSFPTRERCEQILKEPNFDLDCDFECLLCHEKARRAHWVAEHIIEHLRAQEKAEKAAEYKRPIEVD